jgi:hypothetical protein
VLILSLLISQSLGLSLDSNINAVRDNNNNNNININNNIVCDFNNTSLIYDTININKYDKGCNPCNNNSLKFWFSNVTSLVNKFQLFTAELYNGNFDLAFVLETWWNDVSIKNIPGYVVFF